MRQSPSGPVAGYVKYKMPAGTTINGGNSWSSLTNLFGKPGDGTIANWDENSFGPRGNFRLETAIENTGQVLLYVWNPGTVPVTTGLDLFIDIQVIPRG